MKKLQAEMAELSAEDKEKLRKEKQAEIDKLLDFENR